MEPNCISPIASSSVFSKGNQKWCDTVDDSEIRRLPVEGKVVLSHSLQGFIHPRWCRIYSINSNNNVLHSWLCVGVWFYEIRDVIMRAKKKKKKESSWHCSDSGTMKLYAITAHEDLRFFLLSNSSSVTMYIYRLKSCSKCNHWSLKRRRQTYCRVEEKVPQISFSAWSLILPCWG